MADKSLFSRLQRLFSTQAVVRRLGKNKIKVVDSSRLQSSGNSESSSYYDRYGRLHGSNSKKNWQSTNDRFNYHSNKLELYTDYEAMDKDSIISSVLDIYSDECTLKNDMNDVLRINSSNEKIKETLNNLFYDVLNIEFNLWAWIRGMVKYGDYYLYLDIDDELGVVNVQPLSVYETIREEGYDLDNPYSVRFEVEQHNTNHHSAKHNTKYLESFQVAHFRISDSNFLPYGRSLLEGARKTWKQLTLMEDAMMIHRIMRAPEKRIFKIDIGNIPPGEVDTYMRNIIDQMKKTPYKDESTGDYNLKFNLQNMLEDFYLPVRGGQSGTEINSLSGMEFGGIDDVEYLKNRMLAALKVPKTFIGYDEGISGKATLAQQDIRFARSVERIQQIVLSELTKIAIIHLYSQGYTDADLVNFSIQLTNPSVIYDQEKANLWSEKIRLANDLKDSKLISQKWIYENIFNMSEQEWQKEQYGVINDLKLGFRQEQIQNEGNDPSVTGESFGTPHDLATIQQTESGGDSEKPQFENEVPDGGWEGAGRPKEGGNYATDKSPFGRDPLGNKSINSESTNAMLDSMKMKFKTKKIITESLKSNDNEEEIDMLDEKNILESDI